MELSEKRVLRTTAEREDKNREEGENDKTRRSV